MKEQHKQCLLTRNSPLTCSSSWSGNTAAACLSTPALLEHSLLLTLWMVEMTRVSSASSLDRLLDGDTWLWANLELDIRDLETNTVSQ